jgi:hypothetical protein
LGFSEFSVKVARHRNWEFFLAWAVENRVAANDWAGVVVEVRCWGEMKGTNALH